VHLVEVSPSRRKLIEPDVALTQREPSAAPSPAPAGVATLEPVTLSLVIEEEAHERHSEILHRPDRTLVAGLELLSPANKAVPARHPHPAAGARSGPVDRPRRGVPHDLPARALRPLGRLHRTAAGCPGCGAAGVGDGADQRRSVGLKGEWRPSRRGFPLPPSP